MRRWYIVTSYSGHEDSVKTDLLRRRESLGMQNQIYQVLVPEETVETTDKNGKKKTKTVKLYPGYVFVELEVEGEMDDQLWFNIRNTPQVTGFLGSAGAGTKPIPVPKGEMDVVLARVGMYVKPEVDINVGDRVEIKSGSFAGQIGDIASVNLEKEIVTVLIDFFGRSTPTEVSINDVKKL